MDIENLIKITYQLLSQNKDLLCILEKLDKSDIDIYCNNLSNICNRESYMSNLKMNALSCLIISDKILESINTHNIPLFNLITEVLINIASKILTLNYIDETYLLGTRDLFSNKHMYTNYYEMFLIYKKNLNDLINTNFQDVPKIFSPLFEDLYELNILLTNLDTETQNIFIKITNPD